jgi:hypothetical protein
MSKLQRFSKVEIKRDEITRTPEGFLVVPVTATRTGVLQYLQPDGSVVREARLPQDVFSQESMDTMSLIPVTNNHPTGLVTAKNAKHVTVGITGASVQKRDGKYLETSVKIMDEDTINEILGGKVEVSMGYEVEKDATTGRFDEEEYDVVQRNIRYNHLAIVAKGRAGSSVRLRLDSNENEILKGDEVMKKVKFGEKEFDVADELAEEFEKFKADMCAKKDAEDARADALKSSEALTLKAKELEATSAKLDAANEEIAKMKAARLDDAAIEAMAKEMARVQKVAELHLDAKELEGKKTDELKRAVVKKLAPELDEKKLDSAAYLDARFDVIAERGNKDELQKLGVAITDGKVEQKIDANDAKAKQIADAVKAWEKPLSVKAE